MARYYVTGATAAVAVGKKLQVAEVVLDFSSTNLAVGDIVDALEIPADTLVLAAGIEVITAAGSGSPTMDLGDGAAADTWVDGLAGNAAGSSVGSTAKYYASADNLDVLGITAAFDGKIRVFAVLSELGDSGLQNAITPSTTQ
jgi:hypothetical protein